MNDERFYAIGEVSAICSLPIKTLRYYDEIGLVTPMQRSETGNYRYYCENQILSLFIIRKLKRLGFSLKEIRGLMTHSDVPTLQARIESRLEQLQAEIEKLQARYNEGGYLLERLSRGHVVLDAVSRQEARETCTLEVIGNWET